MASDLKRSTSEEEKDDTFTIVCNRVTEIAAAAEATVEGSEEGLPVHEVFKQRLANYRKKIGRQMNFND